MAKPIELVLFGDQTVEKLSCIQALTRYSKVSAGARRLLLESTDILQYHLSQLTKEDRAWDHDIASLVELAEANIADETTNGVIASVLMCIGRLGELIVYCEEDPSILGSREIPVQVLAFCTGLLPAAALVAARDTSELLDIAIEIVSICFRMALDIIRQMKLIEDSKLSWAMTMVGKSPMQVQPILDQFHATHDVPYAKRVAIGVVSDGWITLIGAPSSLSSLIEYSVELSEAPRMSTETNGAVHTAYMPRLDVDKVLGTSPLLSIRLTSKARMLSPGSCEEYAHDTLRSLLSEILIDIAHNVLHVSKTVEACIAPLQGKKSISLTIAGVTGHLPAVQRIIKSKHLEHHIRQHRSQQMSVTRRGGSDSVAIVGMAGRFPGSENIDTFYKDLMEGKRQIKRIPESRFNLDAHYDATGADRNTTSAQHGAFLENPGHFDNRFFNISPREAKQMDPIQRLLMMTSHEALENAGYHKNATLATQSNRIATYFGQAVEDWRDILNSEDIDIYYVPSLSRAFGPSRVNYHHGWGGGSYALDAACSTSTTAIHLACSALRARECDTALAGGGSILASPNTFSGLSKSGMIADNGGCKTYHDDADGYVRGEGVGVVVLKRLEDAYADNDNILAVIKASARTYTTTTTSITHPSAESQARIYEHILREADTKPGEIAYVEMHGTGTQAGDLEEMNSVISVMGRDRSAENVLTVGAVKAAVGHGEGVAGVTSLIKVIMMMREKTIPPQPGIPFKLNHKFPKLDDLHISIAGISGRSMTLRPSPLAIDGKIKCIVNSFDASGGNTSLVVEEPSPRFVKPELESPCSVVALSAKSTTSLRDNRRRLLDYLLRARDAKITDLAYTLSARRMHYTFRAAYSVKSTQDLIGHLQREVAAGEMTDSKSKPAPTSVIFSFTGQGSQYAGMGQQFHQHSSTFRNFLQACQRLADHQNLPKFLHLITDAQSDIFRSSATSVQLAIVALEIATARMLKAIGIVPNAVIGHSLGEYSALCVAGVLSVSDTLFLVGQRALAMESVLQADTYSMLAISQDFDSVRRLLETQPTTLHDKIDIACLNAPQATVVSGPVKGIMLLKSMVEQKGSRAVVLKIRYGFHSKHIEPVLEPFRSKVSGVVFSAPKVPVASTLLGKVVSAGESNVFSASYLCRQARERVDFLGALKAFQSAGHVKAHTSWIEIGPEPICSSFVRACLQVPVTQTFATMRSGEDDRATMCAMLAALYKSGTTIDWPQYYKEFQSSFSLLDLPSYAFDVKDFWTTYVERKVESIDKSHTSEVSSSEVQKSRLAPAFSTTSLQWIEDEQIDAEQISVTFASHTSEANLHRAIIGHKVAGLSVCPLSIFCDMAKSAAQYARQKLQPVRGPLPVMSLREVDMTHALVIPEFKPTAVVKTTVSYSRSTNKAMIQFHSADHGTTVEHGSCEVVFENNTSWSSDLGQTLFLLRSRMHSLRDMAISGRAHRLLKSVAYKLFENVVTYSKDYQGMEEVWIDAECHDALGVVELPSIGNSGNFIHNPYWIDTAIHLVGLLVNGGLKYTEDVACLSVGFKAWRVLEELQPGNKYTTYVNMEETGRNLLQGAAYVFNASGDLVQVTTGIKFLKLKKLTLGSILDPSGTKQATDSMKSPAPAPAPKPKRAAISFPDSSDSESNSDFLDDKEIPTSGSITDASSVDESEQTADPWRAFLEIVASECLVDAEDMDPDTPFAEMGIDSLMAITILAIVKRDTGLELPATFLLDNPTVQEAKRSLVGDAPVKQVAKPRRQIQEQAEILTGSNVVVDDAFTKIDPPFQGRVPLPIDVDTVLPVQFSTPTKLPETTKLEPVQPVHQSKAVLLHGSRSEPRLKLFFLPDGSGSPFQYIQLPPLGSDITTYALESPFLQTPTEYLCSLDTICDSFIASIKTIQPAGPYHLAGFSLGTLYTYLVAEKLLKGGDKVDKLVLIDMAVPTSIDQSITPTQDELQAAGLMPSGNRSTQAQYDHVANTIRAMSNHRLEPLVPDHRPHDAVFISSKAGLAFKKTCKLARWVQGQSHASPSYGWEDLVGPVKTHHVDSEHFSVFKFPAVNQISDILKGVMTGQ